MDRDFRTRPSGQPALTNELTGEHWHYLGLSVLAHALAGLIQMEEESWQWAGRLTSFLWILDKRRESPPVTHMLWDLRDTPRRQCRFLLIEEETQIKRDRVL